MNTLIVEFALPDNEELEIIVQVQFDGHQNAIKSIQLGDSTARKLNLPASVQLGTNNYGEPAFYKYSEDQHETCYFINTPLIKEIIAAILQKKDIITER